MARQKQPKATGSNVDDFVFSYGEDDISQFLQPIQQVQRDEPGFLDKAVDSGKAILEGLSFLPSGIRDTASDVVFGFDPNDEAEMARRREKADEQTAYAKKYEGQAFGGVTDAMTSMPYSLTTMGSALGAGALASPAGPIAAGAAGMAASGTSAYRATVAEFERTMYGASTEALGRKPTEEEWGNINAAFSSEATKYGLWEAGPEAISNLLMVKILGPLGSRFKDGAKGLIKKVAGVYGEEFATETITQMGQGSIEADLGMRDIAPGPGEAFTEIAPATFWQTTLMAGGKKGLDAAYRRTVGQPESDIGGPLIDEPAPREVVQPFETGVQNTSEFGELTGPTWNAPPVAPATMGAEQWNREAAARGWNHLRNDIPPKDDFLPQEEYDATAQWVAEQDRLAGLEQIPTASGLSAALNKGETVDLLSWRGAEENPVYTLDALPPAPRREALPMAGVHGALGLPTGSGAMPMGTRQSGLDPIAPPTEFAGLPVAPPYVERPALPEQSTMGTAQGRWAGGRLQLAYGRPIMGMADALGMGGAQTTQQPAQAIPTQAQITGIQQAPRADTTAHAEALGMPAPQVMPEQDHAVSVQPEQSPSIVTLQAAPAWSYELPSFVGEPYTQPTQNAQTDASGIDLEKLSRAQLIAMLPKKIQAQIKKMDKPAIRELIRIQAQENENAQVQTEAPQQASSEIAPKEQALSETANELNEDEKPIRLQIKSLFNSTEYPDIVVPSDKRMKEKTSSATGGGVVKSYQAQQEKTYAVPEIEANRTSNPREHEDQLPPNVSKIGTGESSGGRSAGHGLQDGGGIPEHTGRTGTQDHLPDTSSRRGKDADGKGREQGPEMGTDDGRKHGRSSRLDATLSEEGNGEVRTLAGTGNRKDAPSRQEGRVARSVDDGRKRKQSNGVNYNAPAGSLARTGSWKETASRNLDIIELSKNLSAEKRPATPEEQALLAQYVGWGPGEIRNKLFPTNSRGGSREINVQQVPEDWNPIAERAKAILSPEEVEAAFRSSQYAHYTSEPMIRSIWDGVARLGFKGGKILEPGMGSGLFAVGSPLHIMEQSQYTGVEMDKLTARIAGHLLPESSVLNADFVKQKLPDDFFDLAIGNPPFAATKILDDPRYKKYRFMLHDYFFAKALDKVRPGGMLVFVTSKGTMDKGADKARAYMAERADLLGAVRLPQTAFKQNAGTEVVTDVLFLRKRQQGENPGNEAWQGLAEIQTPEGPALINEYFARHPEMVLGSHSLKGSMYRADEYTVLPHEGTSIDAQFAKAIKNLPEGAYSEKFTSPIDVKRRQTVERDFTPSHKKEGGVYIDDDGELRRVENGSGVPLTELEKLSSNDVQWLKDYVPLRDALKKAQYDQLNDGAWEQSLHELNTAYDNFVKKHGLIQRFTEYERIVKNEDGEESTRSYKRYSNGKRLSLDIEGVLVNQLEDITEEGDIVKANFLKERTIKKPVTPEIKNIQDALMVSLDQHGHLDIAHIAELAGEKPEKVITQLGDTIFEAPGKGWEMADAYLSGDVVTKLEEAEAAAKADAKYTRNVSALLAVQPKPIAAKDILVDLGATWVPVRHINNFATNIVGIKGAITFNQDAAVYTVPGSEERSRSGSASEWGTPERSQEFLLSAALNNRSVTVRVKTADDKLVVDPNATAAANEKISKLKEAFSSWIWQDKERVEELTALYNRSFNNLAPRTFDGTHLTLPGLSLRYKLYDHQKRAIWRIVQTGNTYLAHAVGAGKTLEMIVSGMEQRRLGLIKRPMYVVPNHMLGQFSAEFQDAYPLARIMVATETNFHTSNRRRFVAQAALNDPDAIVITHSAFGLISTKPETTEEISREFMEQLEEAISESSDRISRSKLEQRLEQAQRRMDARMNKAKDQGVYFEDMGVDFLYVDEAHEFRKLDFVTNRDKVKGVDPNGSERSLDLFSKLAYLRKQNPTRSHVLASGTPVTNTMAELYTLMRYMAPEMLESDGLNSFDAWASMFGRVKTELEQNAAGKYEFVERFSKFVNVPELMKRVRSVMDVLTMSQLGDLVQRPELIGGNPANVVAQASDDVVDYLENVLAARIEKSKKWKPSPSQKGNPDPMVSIITDGRLAALDMRFVSNIAKDDPQSKLNLMIDDIIATYHKTSNLEFATPRAAKSDPVKGATQIVFSAVGFGEQVAARRGFDLRSAMMQRFKEAGIPAKEVAWMGDYKTSSQKGAMFADMRAGKVRILIGSPKNMGTGVNVQKRLAKLHYLSPPWYPADVEQPHGRILRQGNQNKEVAINWYATKGTYDSTMWGMVARKARFIEQAFTGDDSVRSLDDISESSQYEMAAALAAGDERAIQLAGLHSDIERLTRLKAAHADEQRKFKRDDHALTQNIQHGQDKLKAYRVAHKELGLDTITNDSFSVHVGGTSYNKIKEAGEALKESLDATLAAWTPNGSNDKKTITIGKAMGTFPLTVKLDVGVVGEGKLGKRVKDLAVTVGKLEILVHDLKEDVSAQGLGTRLLNKLNSITKNITSIQDEIRAFTREQEQVQKRIGVPFPQEAELSEKIADAEQIKAALAEEGKKIEEQDTATEAPALASIFPTEFLPPHRVGRGMKKNDVQRTVNVLAKRASAAAPVRAVQHFSELPEHVRTAFEDTANSLEGAYDPQDKAVYLVADNITDAGRVAEVWVHEQVVHHGLRSLLSAGERQRIMNRLWLSSGGMGNATIANIAHRYGMNPVRNSADRAIVIEEYLANLAEKRREGLLLSPAEKSLWRRFVDAISKLWNALVGGKNTNADIEGLLTALGQHVMGGLPQRDIGGLDGALASLDEQQGLHQDKKKSLAWARTNRLQLPKVRILPARLSGKSILTEEDVVKPLAPENHAPLASLMDRMTGVEKSLEMVKDENIAHFFPDKTDLTMVQRTAMLPHWIAKKFPQFGVIYKRQLQRMDERNADKEKSLREIPSLFDAKTAIKGKDMDDLRKLIWDNDGKEISELKDTPKFLDADILANGRVLLKENPEWYSVYEQWLAKQPGSDKAQKALLEVRRSLDGDIMRAHNRMAAMSELSDSEIVQHRTNINHQHNYFPHHRYGQYYVQAKVGEDVVFRLHFDAPTRAVAKKRAADFIAEQRKNFPRAAWRADENEKLPDEIYGAPLDPEAMEQVIKTAAGRIGNKEQAEKVRAALQESIADTLKIRGWGSHALHRKGIPGHEEQDILRVLYDYKSGLSGWLTKLEAARDFTEALGKIDARHHPIEWSYASQYVKDMLRNYDKIDRITGNIKSVAFAWYLGANLKTAAVNLTQNLIIGIPRLQMETVGGTGYLAAAQAALVDQVTGRKGKGLNTEEGQLMREMYDNAVITDGYMEEVRGRVNGIDGAVIWNKLLKGMGWPMSVAERFNRASLALAAFRAAREGNLKATVMQEHGIDGRANYAQAKEYAEMIVRDAHYVYGKVNMPEFMRSTSAGRMLSPAYTFRSFSHNTLGLWHWALTSQGKDGAAMVAKSLAATLLIGGIASAPFFATAMALYQAASGDDDDWMEEVRGMVNTYLTKSDMLRDVICYGLPSLAGVNLGGSLKMETPFSQGMKKASTPKEIMTESMGDILGIPYDLFIQRPSKIMEAYHNRNTSRMVEEAMPSFVQNMMRSYRLSTEGQKTMSGRDINEPGEKGARKLTQLEAVGKLLGFQPVSATKSYDRYSARQHADRVRSDKAGEFAAKMLKTREDGGSSAEVRQDIREWNARMKEDGKPWMMIKMEDVQRRMSARRRANRLSKREAPRKAMQAQIWE